MQDDVPDVYHIMGSSMYTVPTDHVLHVKRLLSYLFFGSSSLLQFYDPQDSWPWYMRFYPHVCYRCFVALMLVPPACSMRDACRFLVDDEVDE